MGLKGEDRGLLRHEPLYLCMVRKFYQKSSGVSALNLMGVDGYDYIISLQQFHKWLFHSLHVF